MAVVKRRPVVLLVAALLAVTAVGGFAARAEATLPPGSGCPQPAGTGEEPYEVEVTLPADAPANGNGVCINCGWTGGENNTASLVANAAGCGATLPTVGAGSSYVWADWGTNSCVAPGQTVTIKFRSSGFPLTVEGVTWNLSNGATWAGSAAVSGPLCPDWCAGQGVRLCFTIEEAGVIGTYPGDLALCDGAILIGRWKAGSGDNNPAHDCEKQGPGDNPWGGPIPAGLWDVYPESAPHPDPNCAQHDGRYPLYKTPICNARDCFQIHGSGTTHGCIAIEPGKLQDFKDTVNDYFQSTIPLHVSYGSSVGGIAEPPDLAALPLEPAEPGRDYAFYVAAAAAGGALLALAAGAWYARRRWTG
jgi:hypothetical protein